MNSNIKHIILFSFLIFVTIVNGQNIARIAASSDTINFGETVDILIEVRDLDVNKTFLNYDFTKIYNQLHAKDSLFFEEYADVFVGFENKNVYQYYNLQEKVLNIPTSEPTLPKPLTIVAKIKFLSYGDFVIHPPFYENEAGEIVNLSVNDLKVFVRIPPGMEQIEEVDVSEIKPIVEVYESFWSKYGIVIIGLLIVLLLAFGIKKYLDKLKNRPKAITTQIEEKPDPYLVAMQKLEALNQEKPWLHGDVKEYQSALTMSVREYLEGRYGISALEMTSSEILDKLYDKPIESMLKDDLSDILQVADLVKFAKAKPTSDIHQEFLDKAIRFVVKTRKFVS
jgi:hypothetical protein